VSIDYCNDIASCGTEQVWESYDPEAEAAANGKEDVGTCSAGETLSLTVTEVLYYSCLAMPPYTLLCRFSGFSWFFLLQWWANH
jgi:hypothetical protein